MTLPTPTHRTLQELSTEELKAHLCTIIDGQDRKSLKEKVTQSENELAPYFQALKSRNPFPQPQSQLPILIGTWTPSWSTIPYQDILPGRIRSQSYQIFHSDGSYANIARYAPGHQRLWAKLSSLLVALDLIVLQRFEAQQNRWQIQNVAIKQALRCRSQALTPERADQWFSEVVDQLSKDASASKIDQSLDKSTTKKLQTAFNTEPEFEHLYIDEDFRLVKTRRDPKQRCSYTIVARTLTETGTGT